jgi:transglutaminase-like putative cysteine protease
MKNDQVSQLSVSPQSLEQTSIVYRNPRPFNITYSFELIPDPTKIDRAKDLKIWLPIPREWDSQKAVKIVSVNPPPHDKYEDPEYGNLIYFWDFGKEPEGTSYKVEVKLRLEVYEVHANVDPNQVGTYDKTSEEYALYTRSEHTICITPKVRELAQEAVDDEKNPYLQADRIVKFVMRKVHYKILDFERGRGIQCLLDYPVKDEKTGDEYYQGCCSQISALIIALCRAVGIPARAVYGCKGWNPGREEADLKPLFDFETGLSPTGLACTQHFGHMWPHVWTEIYIPNYGWIPVDGNKVRPIDNKWVIFSKGRDIELGPFAPQKDSEGYGAQFVLLNDGRVDLLGSWGVWNIAKIRTARTKLLITPDPFPADALAEYLSKIYPEDGAERRLKEWRTEILGWFDRKTRGVPDKYTALENAYEKEDRGTIIWNRRSAFICHMLRKVVGDEVFFKIIQNYENLRLASDEPLSTADFQKIAEETYGKPLDWFFLQWAKEMEPAKKTELPELKLDGVNAIKDGNGWQIRGHILQVGEAFFRLPVEFTIETDKDTEHHMIWQDEKDTDFEFTTSNKPIKLRVDADGDIMRIGKMTPHLFRYWDVYPSISVIYGTMKEVDANKAAAELLNNEYLGLGPEIVKADTDVTEDDLKAECVILFGRPAANKIAQRLEDIFPIKIDGAKFTWQGATYDQPTQGVVQMVDYPLDPKRLVMLCAGLSGEATLQISASYLHDAEVSYVIFDRKQLVSSEWFKPDQLLLSGDWEDADNDLVWKFDVGGNESE